MSKNEPTAESAVHFLLLLPSVIFISDLVLFLAHDLGAHIQVVAVGGKKKELLFRLM